MKVKVDQRQQIIRFIQLENDHQEENILNKNPDLDHVEEAEYNHVKGEIEDLKGNWILKWIPIERFPQ